jgi:hypothetical protein
LAKFAKFTNFAEVGEGAAQRGVSLL